MFEHDAFAGGEDGFDAMFWMRGMGTFEGVGILGCFEVADVDAALAVGGFKNAGDILGVDDLSIG